MCAAIVGVFYHGHKYPEHLYFAIHLHAFIFLALALAVLAKFPGLAALAIVGSVVVVIWIPVYATMAFMRVYGESLGSTLIRELGIGALYAVVSVVALILTLYWVSVAA